MCERKNILVLATLDEKGLGHGWSKYKLFKSLGMNVNFLCLLRQHKETDKFIIDSYNKNFRYYFYKICSKVEILSCPMPANRMTRSFYRGIDYTTADEVLKKISIKLDHIIICSYQHFLSPKAIYTIWKKTGAEITIDMVDNKLLGGGCAYPLDCKQYETGCRNCPYYPWYGKFFAKRVYNQKEKYLTLIPFHIAGSTYDLQKTKHVPFLKGKQLHPIITAPTIPFYKTKEEARKDFGISNDTFVIMAGAVNPQVRSKGFAELVESLRRFSCNIDKQKNVILLLLGKNEFELKLPDNITVITPGLLDLHGLFSAYYACDVYLSPSIEDSGPMMVNYAIACGRPVVAFPVGTAIDLVIHKVTGWIAKLKNCSDYSEGINWFYKCTTEQLKEVEEHCIEHITSFKKHPWYEYILKG